ncbi:MAG: tetratricopeptide repeat protein [bacterium]
MKGRILTGRCAIVLLLAGMVVIVYGKTAGYPFVMYDDPLYTVANPFVAKGLTLAGAEWAARTFHAANWHPVTWLSHMMDVSLFGMNAGNHHLVNLLFHMANTLLLFHFLARATGRMWESGLVAALFAIHPLHVESVAWVAERKDVLSTFFLMLTLLAYARYCERPARSRYAAILLFFALGLMSKPMLVTVPFVLLLLDYWPLGRFSPFRSPAGDTGFLPPMQLLREKVPLFVLSGVSCLVTYLAQEKGGAVSTLAVLPGWARGANALLAYAGYLWKTVWPSGLAVYYPHPGTAISVWKVAAAGTFLCWVTAVAVRQARNRPYILVGWLWYLGTLVPVAGFVQVGLQTMADRYTYVPLIGIFIAAAWGMGDLARGWKVPRLAAGIIVFWLAGLAVCAWYQAGFWRDSSSLFTRDLEVTRENWFIRNSLGWSLLREGKDAESIHQFREAIRIRPEYAEAHYNLGKALSRFETIDEAIASFESALRFRPEYAEAHNDLGAALEIKGPAEMAIAHYREALRLRPDFAEVHYNLGRALSLQNAVGEATIHLREAVRLSPEYVEARNNLGVILARQGEYAEAESQFREALRIKPDYAGAQRNLERVLGGMDDAGRKTRR